MTRSVFSQEYEKLRRLLIAARREASLTQSDVASVLGKPQPFVSKYERGERRLDVVEFLQVADALAVDPVAILRQLRTRSSDNQDNTEDILETWSITPNDLTTILKQSPSLQGMLFGYIAEFKLEELWLEHPDIAGVVKDDDHDRRKKGDRRFIYKGHSFILEAKSLQTSSIKHTSDGWTGSTQVDASDRREIVLPSGEKVNTTLLLVGEFDVLAVNVFPFENNWNFVFAKNQDLPRSTYRGYTPEQRQYLLASLIPITWPPEPPFTDNLYYLLDELVEERFSRTS
ncbi:MAG: helix-turn-helix transcriptional regulator [Anaerolineales bacterium]|nr:helix-turn-helix transcriptional regulator [Anaerolineales bacterium]